MVDIIFVIGPVWKNLDTLLETIKINKSMINNIKKIYIPTNNKDVEKYFLENPIDNIICKYYFENKNHQLSCYNSLISGMKMILEYENNNENNNENDIVIFSHEDCYIKNIDLFNKNINILKNNTYDIVCREFDAPLSRNHFDKYYMFDTFFIKKKSVKKIFGLTNLFDNFYDFGIKPLNYENYHAKDKKFCEAHFTRIIKNFNIYSILYSAVTEERVICTEFGNFEAHGTWKNTELGFYHIPGRIH